VGLEWVRSFDNGDKGIGVDSDLLSPFLGIALVVRDNLVLVPMLQHFTEYSGDDLDITAARMVAVWKFAAINWIKVDAGCPMTGIAIAKAKAKELGIAVPIAEYAYRIIQLQDRHAR